MTTINWDEEKYPETHDFGKEPIVEGYLVKQGTVPISGRQAGFIILDTEKGKRTIWRGAVIKAALDREEVFIGNYIGIKYLGETQNKTGTYKYKDFDVRVVAQAEEEEEV